MEGRVLCIFWNKIALAFCDRVGIIRQGEIVESGTLAELRHLTRKTVTAETIKPVADLDKFPGVHDVSHLGAFYG